MQRDVGSNVFRCCKECSLEFSSKVQHQSMDIARPDQTRKRRRRRILYATATVLTLALISFGVSRLKPALPLVENAYTDTVKRGEMPLQVRGNGTLVPELIR